MRDLSEIRQDINSVDQELSRYFEKRMNLAKEVAAYKAASGKPIYDPEREREVIENRKKAFPYQDDDFLNSLERFYETLMELSREEQKRLIDRPAKIGYYGVPGSFTNEAFIQLFGEETPSQSYSQFREIFEALEKGEIRYGLVPVENSLTGIINDVYDLLGEYNFYIVRETMLRIQQNLLGVPGASMEEIQEVYSHPQGFAQSAEFLSGFPGWKLVPYYNTSQSASLVSEKQDKTKACIASLRSAKLYHLEVLQEGIQDNQENYTRFVLVSPKMEADPAADKISLFFTLEHRPGSLYSMLEAFYEAGINLNRIDSRPIKGKVWEYAFFVDIDGNLNEEKARTALEKVRLHANAWHVLGNYRKL